jgi:hypothetical protein
VIVYVTGREHPVVVRDAADMPPPETIREMLIFSPDPGRPSPDDLCSWGQLRRALRRVYVRAEADRLWAAETHQGLDRAGVSFGDDVLFPVALLSGAHWARVRRERGWSRRRMHARLAAWQREVAGRPTARVPGSSPGRRVPPLDVATEATRYAGRSQRPRRSHRPRPSSRPHDRAPEFGRPAAARDGPSEPWPIDDLRTHALPTAGRPLSDEVLQLLAGAFGEADLGDGYVGPEHLVLALTAAEGGPAALGRVGVDPARVRAALVRSRAPHAGGGRRLAPPPENVYTERTRHAFALAAACARDLGQDPVSVGCLLVGLLQEGGSVGAEALTRGGLTVARALGIAGRR